MGLSMRTILQYNDNVCYQINTPIKSNILSMFKRVHKILHQFDMFSSSPILRAKAEPDVANSCGGLTSLIVLILFTYIFIYQFILVATWQSITSVQTEGNSLESSKVVSEFMIGIGVSGFQFDQIQPYLRYQMVEVTMNGTRFMGFRVLQTQRCQKSHWSPYVADVDKAYESFDITNKLCLKPGQNISIMQNSVGQYKFVQAIVNMCRRLNGDGSLMYQGCQSANNTQTGNQYWISTHKYFTVNILYVNTAFSPTQKVATTTYINSVRLTFTITRGTEAFVYLSPYQITTDQSITPFNQYVVEEGYTLDRVELESFEAVPYFQQVNCIFLLSSKTLTFDRSMGKIDAILSYAGGLFGIIISFLAFFMMSFNQYRYELLVAEGAFNYSEDGRRVKQTDFHFLMYLKYSLYDWVTTLLCIEPKWDDCRQIDQTREEANQQLDVSLLFKKIQHFQRVNAYLMSQKQDIALYLTEPPSLDQVKRKRQIASYYDKIVGGKNAVTIEDVSNAQILFQKVLIDQNTFLPVTRQQLMNTTKSKLNQLPQKSRQNILEYALQKFSQEIDVDDVKLNQDQAKIELQIAESFFRMPDIARRKIQQKIPIKILKRLSKCMKQVYRSKLCKLIWRYDYNKFFKTHIFFRS